MDADRRAFTLLEIMIVASVIGLLAVLAIPSYLRSRDQAHRSACVNSLRQIAYAKDKVSMASGWTDDTSCDEAANKALVDAEISRGGPRCPFGGGYVYGPVGAHPLCSEPGHTL
jgi:prepilin-type N-terminal cleavage/methylation domain-containing protein